MSISTNAEKPTVRRRTLKPLLVTRKDAAALLGGISHAQLRQFELQGVLRGVRLNAKSQRSQVFYRYSDLVEIVANAPDAKPGDDDGDQ